MVRAALTKQAEAIIRQGAALEAGSSGGRGGAGGTGVAGRNGDCSSSSDLSRPGGQPGQAAAEEVTAAASVPAVKEPTNTMPRPPPDCEVSDSTPAGARQLTLGKILRGTTAAGRESWALFRFNLTTAGPILTFVLDIVDGDPDIVVCKGRIASARFGLKGCSGAAVAAGAKSTVTTVAPQPTRGTEGERKDSATASGVQGGVGGSDDGGEWKASSTHRGLRVVKIFPRDPG